jgi:hypothetical protein
MAVGAILAMACNNPAEERREAREETKDVGRAEAERAREIAEQSRESAADVREERKEAVEAWKEAFRAEMQQSLTLTRRIDRRINGLESQLTAWEQAVSGGDNTKQEETRASIETLRGRLEKLTAESDAGPDQRSLVERIDRDLDQLEKEILAGRAQAKVPAGT